MQPDKKAKKPSRGKKEARKDSSSGARYRVTLADIAQACGVSPATVSLALRGNPLVNSATRARIQAEVRRQGYVYNRSAANLRRQVSSSVALVVNDLSNPFFAEFAAGVDERLATAGYITLLGSTSESLERQNTVLRSLMEHCPAGVILSPAEHSESAALEPLFGGHTPVVVFNREVPGGNWDFLVCDNRAGARVATEHLLGLGHTRITFVGGHVDSSSCRERRAGYLDAMWGAGFEPAAGWLIECAPTRLEGARAGAGLLERVPEASAAVCYNDIVALGLMSGLTARGRRIGEDFAVTGFDDIPEASVVSPTLTTLAVGPRALGRWSAELVLQCVELSGHSAERVVAPVELVVRGSSCPPPCTIDGPGS